MDDQRTPWVAKFPKCTADYFADKGITLRPYQYDTVNTLIESEGGIGLLATGAGKSFTCAALAHIFNSVEWRCLVIVPTADLCTQTWESFEQAGVDAGQYSGDIKQLNNQTTIATWQSLQHNPNIMQSYDAVIVDECHGTRGMVIRELINTHGARLKIRIGVTGTLPKPMTELYDVLLTLRGSSCYCNIKVVD